MKQEYGRSLIEIIAVLAIGAVMTGATIAMYRSIRTNMARSVATAELEQVAKNVKLLTGARGTYDGVSVEYLVKSGALESDAAPIGTDDWTVDPSYDGTSFSINLHGLTSGECAYFEIKKPKWANAMLINGNEAAKTSHCFSTKTNMISFIVE